MLPPCLCPLQEQHIIQLKATQETTVDDIKAAFNQLRDECQKEPDAQFFIWVHYSGHGTTVLHLDGDELSYSPCPARQRAYKGKGLKWIDSVKRLSRDEVLAVHRGCSIKDYEVHGLLDMGNNASIFCVFDCCHSATMADLHYMYSPPDSPLKDTNSSSSSSSSGSACSDVWVPSPCRRKSSKHDSAECGEPTQKVLHHVISLSACQDYQEARMASDSQGVTVGQLTNALLRCWESKGGLELRITSDLIESVAEWVAAHSGGQQLPQLTSSFHLSERATAFDPDSWGQRKSSPRYGTLADLPPAAIRQDAPSEKNFGLFRGSRSHRDEKVKPRLHRDGTFSCSYGKLDTDEVQEAHDDFIEYDRDGDGIINLRDFQSAMTRHDPSWARAGRRATLEAMFAAVDRDGDGIVNFEDFAVMKVQKKLALGQASAKHHKRPSSRPKRQDDEMSASSSSGSNASTISV